MNTPAISPLAALTPAANTNKQDASASSEAGAFNQVLNREIAGRNNTENNASSSNNEVSKNTQKDASNKDDKSSTSGTGNSSEASGKTDTTKATDDDKTTTAADGKKEDADPVVAGPSAELLAFVAALTQSNTAQAPVTDAAVDTVAAAKVSDIDTKLDATLGAATATTGSETEAIGKKSDFVAALDKATTSAGDGSKTAAPAAAPKPEADLAAVVTTVAPKTAETVSVANPQIIAAVNTAALQQLAEAHAPQSNKLAPQVGSPGWDQALGQKVVWMVQGAQQTATLTLNPPDLGPMQVTLNVSNNQATASFTAHQPEVRHALEAAMPRLREMLNDAGIQLGQSNVSAGNPNQQNAFSEQRQGGRSSAQNNTVDEAIAHVSHVPVPSSGNGIVDTFA